MFKRMTESRSVHIEEIWDRFKTSYNDDIMLDLMRAFSARYDRSMKVYPIMTLVNQENMIVQGRRTNEFIIERGFRLV